MVFYKEILEKGLTYKQALKKARRGQAVTRPAEWGGIHMEIKDSYYIVLKTGEVLVNPEEIQNTDRTCKDWAVVVPTKRALTKVVGKNEVLVL